MPPDQSGPEADGSDPLFRTFTEVMILSHLVTTAFEAVLPGGMSMAQFGVLNHLCRVGDGQTQVGIARAMQVRKSTMTSTLAALQAAGHVTVTPDDEDRRSKRVWLTDAGRAARASAIAAVGPEMQALKALIDPADITAALPILERVRRVLDRRRDGAT